ncbi:MAG: DUF455 family protein [Myxococcales bacterium]|nr:DUF455 family protein [Myxococcales bacterium]
MEIRLFAESILYHCDLAAKIVDPGDVTDLSPGPARAIPQAPARSASLALRGRKAPSFPAASALIASEARGAALHFFANHELLALELMALMLLRFPNAPAPYRRTLVDTMVDEQRHLRLYLARMAEHGMALGDLGVSAFFWDALADARSPAAFSAGMGLTLEQANLDFATHFERAFADAGDAATAAVLRTVRIDEISHLRQGRIWFDRLTGCETGTDDATLFQRWADALKPPLTPARARGMDFDVRGRRAAGLPEDFIEQVRLARHSKGRPPVVHTFEPACELQLAHGRPGLVLPRPIVQLAADLETLPVAWARADDVVLVRKLSEVSVLGIWEQAGLDVPEFMETPLDAPALPTGHPLRTRQLGPLNPWGWSPDTVARLRPCFDGVVSGSEGLPQLDASGQLPQGIADLSRKSHWPQVLQQWASTREQNLPGATRVPIWTCTTRRQALDAVTELHDSGQDAVIKATLGTSGHGAIRILLREGAPSPTQRKWLDRCLGKQDAVVVMPWLDRVVDLSVQLQVSTDGMARSLGVTRFFTDRRGQYTGTLLGRPSWGLPADVQAFWHGGGDKRAGVPRALEDLGLTVGQHLAEAGFKGSAGVDALIFRDEQGALQLHPLLEVNPRMTMGQVGLALQRKMVPGRSGLLLLAGQRQLRDSGAANWPALLKLCQARLPLMPGQGRHLGKLAQGVVPLADPARVRMALPLWIVARSGTELQAATDALGLPLPWTGCEAIG